MKLGPFELRSPFVRRKVDPTNQPITARAAAAPQQDLSQLKVIGSLKPAPPEWRVRLTEPPIGHEEDVKP
jgi:hypothetical protein